MSHIKLGVNIDHSATVRQARGVSYPDPVEIALLAEQGGADYITAHLREDRRHIQDQDVENLCRHLNTYLNLEIAVTDEMLAIASRLQPRDVCLVPEKRAELTTEGGLDVASQQQKISEACSRLTEAGIRVSLFIDANPHQLEAALATGATAIELHTGHYANLAETKRESVLAEIHRVGLMAEKAGLIVNAGHGLTLENVGAVAALGCIRELNIGHSIVSRALYVGMVEAVREMKTAITAHY